MPERKNMLEGLQAVKEGRAFACRPVVWKEQGKYKQRDQWSFILLSKENGRFVLNRDFYFKEDLDDYLAKDYETIDTYFSPIPNNPEEIFCDWDTFTLDELRTMLADM